jgi:hypothetical protein
MWEKFCVTIIVVVIVISYDIGGPLVDPFWYPTSRSLFNGLP